MTGSATPASLSDLHEATTAFLAARESVQLWQALLGHAIAAVDGYGGSFWVPDAGGLARIMVGGVDELAREVQRLDGDGQTRLTEHEANSYVIAREIKTPEKKVLGVLRILRPGDSGAPDDTQRENLAAMLGVASTIGAFLHREGELKAKARDFTLVAELSREVTATLDLDRVLRAVVNLAARALTFDRGALALYEDGRCDIRALSGADTVDAEDPHLKDLVERAAWAAGRGEGLYVSDREDPGSDAERMFLQFFSGDLEADDVRSGLYLPLRDEEGIVGILVLEAKRAEFATQHQRDVAEILANQATVAIRNARLYSQVPLVDMLGAIGARRRALRALPKRTKRLAAVGVLAGLLLLTLVRWPLRVDGADVVLLPAERHIVRSLVDGQIEGVLVRSGQVVAQGDPLLRLRSSDRRGARDAAEAGVLAAEREASLAASRGDAVGERIARLRAATARQAVQLVASEVQATVIRAPVAGTVLSERLDELLESRAPAGAPLLVIGRTDSLEVQFTVPQREIARVVVNQRVRLRSEALPQRTFEGRVLSIAPLPSGTSDTVTAADFPVRALIANQDDLLRPGMTPFLRVLTAPASLGARLVRRPMRALRLLFWRLTA
ncbi:MAG: HlyD family efflux transporter periplasmic adaptor subunit [Gemmatimonadota bacterium]